MKESSHTQPTGEPEETLVTPRFDAEETVQAQPVVPLAEVPPGAGAAPYQGARRRASWPLALVLASALAGVVVGGAGLYFYQHRSTENATADTQPAPTTSTEAPPVTSSGEVSASLPPQEAEPDAEVVSAEVVEPPADDAKKTDDAKKEETEKAPAPEPRVAAERDAGANTPKQGKKGEREAEPARRTPRAERVGSSEVARDDDDDEPRARLSDEIIFRRERRAERRAERRERRANRQRSVDRVRGIFEGQPD